ncbi:hypothetical protein I203_104928 [Kwoniella mangroviensis CBS 8507]|uniref:uncharacterized protein n=1 Tax=Kwoniella mangroviensis CBS 8507 TaxID=1296122 RepID=UPI0030700730
MAPKPIVTIHSAENAGKRPTLASQHLLSAQSHATTITDKPYQHLAVELAWEGLAYALGHFGPDDTKLKSVGKKSWSMLPMATLMPYMVNELVHSDVLWKIDFAKTRCQDSDSVPCCASNLSSFLNPQLFLNVPLPTPHMISLSRSPDMSDMVPEVEEFIDVHTDDTQQPSQYYKVLLEQAEDDEKTSKLETEADLMEDISQDQDEALVGTSGIAGEDLGDHATRAIYGDLRYARGAFSWASRPIPLPTPPPLAAINDVEGSLRFLKFRLVRGYVFKNGIPLAAAEECADALLICLRPLLPNIESIHRLIIAPYTSDPFQILKDTPFLSGGSQSFHSILSSTKNPTIRSRIQILLDALASTALLIDPSVQPLLDQYTVSAPTTISLSQAGLLAGTPPARLLNELRELERVPDTLEAGKAVRTWGELLYSSRHGQNADYFGVLPYDTLTDLLGCNTLEARMVVECGLYALLEGPTNLKIIAFDDVWRSPNVTGQLALLKMDTGLEIASGNVMSAIVLQEIGYNAFSLVEDQSLRLIPINSSAFDPTKPYECRSSIQLSSIYPDSIFKSISPAQMVLVSHPCVARC